jgi:hypothetical protein
MVSTEVIVHEASVESSASGVHWGAIFAGAVGAVGVTIILVSLGPGLGLRYLLGLPPRRLLQHSASPPASG